MNSLAIELTRLIGKKELTFGCLVQNNWSDSHKPYVYVYGNQFYSKQFDKMMSVTKRREGEEKEPIEIIGNPATETDFKRWMNEKGIAWEQGYNKLFIYSKNKGLITIPYYSSKYLLPEYEGAPCQSEETLKQIVSLVKETQLIKSNQ